MSVCDCSLAGTAACQHCRNNPTATDVWTNSGTYATGTSCVMYYKPIESEKVKTNADRIRTMTDEELAVWISALYSTQYHVKADPNYWLDWLRQEASDA